MKRVSLTVKFTVLFVGLVAVLLGVLGFWNASAQKQQAELEMQEKAQILASEMDAVWQFFETNQEQFVKDESGNYTLYCVIAAKSVSTFFTSDTDYNIHYTNITTRRAADAPDSFEREALTVFSNDSNISEYYGMSEDNTGQQVFRYMQPIFMKESCLECHGSLAGELDSFGYVKEGKELNDLAGAVSITMPVGLYLQGVQNNIWRTTLVSGIIVVFGFLVVIFSVSMLVTRPLHKLESVAESIGSGDLDVDVHGIGYQDEIQELAVRFDEMAQRLKQSYTHLENQVQARTSELASANKELGAANSVLEEQQKQLKEINEVLRESNAFKSDSLAAMSHELRTPLTSIIAFTEIREKESKNKGADTSELEAIQEIHENGQLLLNMVDNILEVARSEAGKNTKNIEPVDMCDLVNAVNRRFEFLAQKRSIVFTVHVDSDVPIIMADWDKLRRILENLVANALKYTRFGGTVSVVVNNVPEQGSVLIKVIDNGIGISKDNLSHIFDKYTQIDESSKRRYSGSGLGLAVVEDFVELHEGSIEVSSEVGVGSTFSVRIPYGDNVWCDEDE